MFSSSRASASGSHDSEAKTAEWRKTDPWKRGMDPRVGGHTLLKEAEAARAASEATRFADMADAAAASGSAAPAPAPTGPIVVDEETLAAALEAKAKGNAHFQAKEWDAAIDCYTDAIEMMPAGASECAAFYANRAACFAKRASHQCVVEDCTAALKLQPEYTKALMRRSIAREALDEPTEALEDAKKAAELDPTSREAASAIPRLEKLSAAKLEQQAYMAVASFFLAFGSFFFAQRTPPPLEPRSCLCFAAARSTHTSRETLPPTLLLLLLTTKNALCVCVRVRCVAMLLRESRRRR